MFKWISNKLSSRKRTANIGVSQNSEKTSLVLLIPNCEALQLNVELQDSNIDAELFSTLYNEHCHSINTHPFMDLVEYKSWLIDVLNEGPISLASDALDLSIKPAQTRVFNIEKLGDMLTVLKEYCSQSEQLGDDSLFRAYIGMQKQLKKMRVERLLHTELLVLQRLNINLERPLTISEAQRWDTQLALISKRTWKVM